MKFKALLSISLIFFIFNWTSCDKDTNEPLSLHGVENNTLQLYYGSEGGVTITGGDGNYSFSCGSPLLKAEMTHSNYILFEPLDVGDATVTIKDSSGNSYILNITITYTTENIVITQLDATVIGDQMTVSEQKELKAKAFATIPVNAGGGYKFVYTEGYQKDGTGGVVFIYPDLFGEESTEGTFERTLVKRDDGTYSYSIYSLHYEDNDRTFIFMEYRKPIIKSSQAEYRPLQFAEDLKDQYETEYPNVEQVYTSQIIKSMAIE